MSNTNNLSDLSSLVKGHSYSFFLKEDSYLHLEYKGQEYAVEGYPLVIKGKLKSNQKHLIEVELGVRCVDILGGEGERIDAKKLVHSTGSGEMETNSEDNQKRNEHLVDKCGVEIKKDLVGKKIYLDRSLEYLATILKIDLDIYI